MGAAVAIMLRAAAIPAGAADEPAKPELAVSVFVLGPTGGDLDARDLVRALNDAGWCRATAAAKTDRWNRPPAGADPAAWLSVSIVGFGERAHAYAFRFDGPGAAPRLVAHVPYGISWVQGQKVWLVPGGRIVAGVRRGWASSPSGRPAAVSAASWAEESKASAAGSAEMALESMTASKDPSSVDPTVAMKALEPAFFAAACEAGWQPSASAPDAVSLQVRLAFASAAFRVSGPAGSGRASRVKEGVPEEQYHGHLRRMLLVLDPASGVTDFARVADGAANLLAAAPAALCLASGDGPAGFNPQTGACVWPKDTKKVETRGPPLRFVARASGEGVALYRYTRGLARIDPATGAEQAIAAESPRDANGFAVAESGLAVLARGSAVEAWRGGALQWRAEQAAEVSAGPAISGDRAIAGTADGDVIALSLDGGREAWRVRAGQPAGAIGMLDGRAMVFDGAGDALLALSPADGSTVWRRELGDVLLAPPTRAGERILAVGKNSRILLLGAADGAAAAEAKWPTWFTDVLSVPLAGRPAILCADIRGRITVLDGADLKPQREVRLPARPSGRLVFASAFPHRWGASPEAEGGLLGGDSDAAGPAVLAADQEGYIYIIPIGTPAGRKGE